VSSTRNTPAYPSPNGTTAELKMLFARGTWSRGTMGLRLERQSTPLDPGGRSSHGMGAALVERAGALVLEPATQQPASVVELAAT
jgi:hypothetical protein